MFKNLKNKKKKGFTLVELIAVIAIIGILAAVLVPTISGYLTKAKKAKVVEQARQFVMAGEAVNAEKSGSVVAGNTVADVATKIADIIPNATAELDLIDSIKFSEAKEIVNGDKDFDINTDTGKFTAVKAKS